MTEETLLGIIFAIAIAWAIVAWALQWRKEARAERQSAVFDPDWDQGGGDAGARDPADAGGGGEARRGTAGPAGAADHRPGWRHFN